MNVRAEAFGGPQARKSRLLVRKNPKQTHGAGLTGVTIPRVEPRRTDMRSEDRPVLRAKMFAAHFRQRFHEVEVINISGGGAMIAADLHPNICEPFELQLGKGDVIECVVRWVKEGRIGLEFAHETKLECPAEKQMELLREVITQRFPDDKLKIVQVESNEMNHRGGDRHPLIWTGDLHYCSESWRARLRNISETGAMIQFTGTVPVGAEVVLDLGNAGSLPALVSWFIGDHAGLSFSVPFDVGELAKSKPQVAGPTWLRPDYLAKETAENSAWDETWNRVSVDVLRTELEGFLKR